MNDATYTNASDPNSMIDQGGSRNVVYNIVLDGHPSIQSSMYSKALDPPDPMNNSFYSFGAQHTNIRKQMSTPQSNASKKTVNLLDNKFRDIRE